ncbi:hypothetical protein GCM10007424_01320 [Flavobacterium suaedae]|uniref:Uncharacterized protein n=1 Tax=Flavobacterium suaedae TaxID=1767027 RepID=A0ABQ1JFH4_9FLAO|nr:hypothetical protein [Flavobacterium suaedae]GGB65149.1 hypothetical protein GCM10007424_01320 [Flavobacterium suaedae]
MKTLYLLTAFLCCTYSIGQSLAAPTEYPVFVDVVGAGDLQQSVSSGSDTKASTGAGIIFERYFGTIDEANGEGTKNFIQTLEVELVINIASTSDSIIAQFNEAGKFTNRRDFGNFILYPIGKKQSMYFNSNLYFGNYDDFFSKVISGINVRILTSNNSWKYQESIIDMGVLSFRAGIFHEFIPDNYRLHNGRAKYSIFLGANYSYRGIIGDISSDGNREFRQNVLGSDETNFSGLEFNLGFRLANLRFELQIPSFRNKNSISGLTDTQFLYSVRFIGGFPLKINLNESN